MDKRENEWNDYYALFSLLYYHTYLSKVKHFYKQYGYNICRDNACIEIEKEIISLENPTLEQVERNLHFSGKIAEDDEIEPTIEKIKSISSIEGIEDKIEDYCKKNLSKEIISSFVDDLEGGKLPQNKDLLKEIEEISFFGEEKEFADLVDFSELLQMEMQEPNWIVKDILPEGLTILAGKAKTGKSYMLLSLAIDILLGGQVFGHYQAFQSEVLFLGLEDTFRRLKKRVEEIQPDLPKGLIGQTHWEMGQEGQKELERLLDRKPNVKCVIIDTLAKVRDFQKSKQNPYQVDYKEIAAWAQIARDRGISIVFAHHLNKGEEKIDPLDLVNGTSGITAAADNVWILQPLSKKGVDAFLYVRGNDAEQQEIALKFENKLWIYQGDADEYKATEGENQLLNAFDDDEIITPREAQARLEITYSAVKMKISRLENKGTIKKIGRGQYKKIL